MQGERDNQKKQQNDHKRLENRGGKETGTGRSRAGFASMERFPWHLLPE